MTFQIRCCAETLSTFIANIRLCTSVNTNMTLHIGDCHKLLYTIRTRMRSVHTSFMSLQVARGGETCATQWTLVCTLSWWCDLKVSEQCLHENGFAPVWTRTWRFKSPTPTNSLPHKLFRTVSTRERLYTSVNTNMTLHSIDCCKLLPTIKTRMRSYVAVHTSFMSLQVARGGETFVTQWTLVWFISSVHS